MPILRVKTNTNAGAGFLTMRYQVLRDLYNTYIFGWALLSMLKGCKKVLELGCGKNSLLVKSDIVRKMDVTGVDIFKPYVDSHIADGTYKSCICADITKIDFGEGEFDAVVCMEVLEHISKREVIGSGLLSKMQGWGKKIIITTPNGYIDNELSDGNRYQRHISGWSIEELESYGYNVSGLSGWKKLRKEGGELRYVFPYLFWAGVSLMSGIVTNFVPRWSYHLLATYERGK